MLIIGPSWVGDMVMAQALFKLIKQLDSQCVLHVLAPAWTFSLIAAMPEVQKAIEMPFAHGELCLKKRVQFAKSLQQNCYDQAIVLPNSFKSALIPWFANIPIRTGWRGEWRYLLLNDIRVLDKKRYPRMIEQYLALGLKKNASLPNPYPYPFFKNDTAKVNQILSKYHIPLQEHKKKLALCAGAEFGPAKRWPEAYYAAVANQKISEGWEVWLFGSRKDLAVTDKIMAATQNRCINFAGRLELSETVALFSLVSGVVTNDSGLMHVACALQKPLIAIYGSTSDRFTPPLSDCAQVLKLALPCQPCFKRTCPLSHHRCMRDISPNKVLTAMQSWVR